MTRRVTFRPADATGLHQTGTTDTGEIVCLSCGQRWPKQDRYLRWPIRLGWGWRGFWSARRLARKYGRPRPVVDWHGWQVGTDGPGQRVFGRTLHLGPLLVMFGPPLRRRRGTGPK